MDNMTDYIAWLGDISFDVRPLCEADAMILCAISYYDLSPAMDSDGAPFLFKDALTNIESGDLQIRITGGEQGLTEVLRSAAASKRFGELKISNYVDRFEPDKDLQFAAVTFSYKDRFSFIAYRGTDNTLVGWKEDFMIAYTRTEAQKLALDYARQLIKEPVASPQGFSSRMKEFFRRKSGADAAQTGNAAGIPGSAAPAGHRWYIGGHSKGANLALFAACQLSDAQLQQVEHIYILDGPGFAPEVMDTSLQSRIDSKATRIIPEYSVVGRLMEPQITDTRIVRSSNDGAMQHAIGSWGIYHGGLALAEDQTPKDRWINETLRKWIDNMPYEGRRTFVNELFDALGAGGASTLDDLASGGRDGLEAVFKSVRNFSGSTREILSDLRDAAVSELKESAIEGARKTIFRAAGQRSE